MLESSGDKTDVEDDSNVAGTLRTSLRDVEFVFVTGQGRSKETTD